MCAAASLDVGRVAAAGATQRTLLYRFVERRRRRDVIVVVVVDVAPAVT